MIKLLGLTKGSGRIPGALMRRRDPPPPEPPVAKLGWLRTVAVTFTVPAYPFRPAMVRVEVAFVPTDDVSWLGLAAIP